eukprot:jgi/Botrbrau1/14534/Bobra.0212s0001.1
MARIKSTAKKQRALQGTAKGSEGLQTKLLDESDGQHQICQIAQHLRAWTCTRRFAICGRMPVGAGQM